MQFRRNPSPRRPSNTSFEYLLLPPRSALMAASITFTCAIFTATITPLYTIEWRATRITIPLLLMIDQHTFKQWAKYRTHAQAPSIFRAHPFGRWVVTHSLADADFHGHCPAVSMNELLFCLFLREVRLLISAFGSSRSASSAYQKWPTWH